VTKETKGRRRRTVPIIDPLRPTLVRLTAGRRSEERLVLGPRGGVITTATLRDATGWGALVTELGQPRLVRHGLRHTALTWMADAGVDLHILQRVAGHHHTPVVAGPERMSDATRASYSAQRAPQACRQHTQNRTNVRSLGMSARAGAGAIGVTVVAG
jgi:integrase